MVRVAVLDGDKCESKRCGKVCYRFCPPVRSKIEAIRFEGDKPVVVESLCVGCGICVRKCPFKALSIVNLPDELEGECSHRFGPNTFKLFRLPIPSPGGVLGLLGQNGIGKSTALKILSGEIKLNLGKYEQPPEWSDVIQRYRGSTLQDYLKKLSEKQLRVVSKPQYVDKLPQAVSGKVSSLLKKIDERDMFKTLVNQLQLGNILNRGIDVLSGGELQRVAIAATISRNADVYLFDEPSSYLDVNTTLPYSTTYRITSVSSTAAPQFTE
jgi:ATP-binding cassette subfamily E protein 1